MGTRAIITFKDADQTIHVYKHWDGNPENILELIDKSKALAWTLPRFEADEFAAAFVATAKTGSGDVRLLSGKAYPDMGQEYHYVVTLKIGRLDVKVKEV